MFGQETIIRSSQSQKNNGNFGTRMELNETNYQKVENISFEKQLPEGFVYVRDVIPDIVLEILYCSNRNFTGQPVDGYIKPKAILTMEAAKSLKEVQNELRIYSLGLKIFDAYRPQQAVDCFSKWAKSPEDHTTKALYYPNEEKESLFENGYISLTSSHIRGSTVDLTLVHINGKKNVVELDMGRSFDYFGKEAWGNYANCTPQQKANRLLLKTIMGKHRFESYPREWWHFTLKDEPFPNTTFNFPIE